MFKHFYTNKGLLTFIEKRLINLETEKVQNKSKYF